ncbi:unnamed protein product [Phaeothamnion confervicola]
MMTEVEVSTDPAVKRLRLRFKTLCRGSFNRLSSNVEQIRNTVSEICGKGTDLMAEAGDGPEGVALRRYFFYSLAQQVVSRAEGDQFDASDYEAAWPIAAVAVEVAAAEPTLAATLRALLRRDCPYLVPEVSFDSRGMNDAAVRRRLGWREGETLDKHVRRMQNLVVVAGAIMQAPLPRGASGAAMDPSRHPLPLSEGWKWLARLLNQLAAFRRRGEPLPAPTAPVLEVFLRIAGNAMERAYGRQFQKLVEVVSMAVVPQLEDKTVVPHLLDSLLADFRRNRGKFAPPKGRKALESGIPWGAVAS